MLEIVDKSNKEFLLILAYLYVSHSKHNDALKIYRALYEFFKYDIDVLLGLMLVLYFTDRSKEAKKYVEILDFEKLNDNQASIFNLIKSHILWDLGSESEARVALINYLGFQDKINRVKEIFK